MKSRGGMEDIKSGRDLFEAARIELGYEKNLLCDEGKTYMGQETTGEYTMEVQHDCRCDELSRQIAMECDQAKNFPPEGRLR